MTEQDAEMKSVKNLDELEMYELLVAAYPEKFDEDADGDIWDEVMDFEQELAEQIGSDPETLRHLIGRLVMLAMPMASAITNEHRHALGPVTITDGQAYMMAAVTRPAAVASK